MTIRTKLVTAGVVLVAAVGYLATAGAKSGWVYYLEVDHFLADSQYHSQRVRLHGKVASDRLEVSAAALSASFDLLGKSKSVAVQYRGGIPEMFEGGRDVVVEGQLDPATNVFRADVLMTKCASKYEPNSPHNNAAGGKELAQ
jgi:cytochrome c-type biogenesis protein CcmE